MLDFLTTKMDYRQLYSRFLTIIIYFTGKHLINISIKKMVLLLFFKLQSTYDNVENFVFNLFPVKYKSL